MMTNVLTIDTIGLCGTQLNILITIHLCVNRKIVNTVKLLVLIHNDPQEAPEDRRRDEC